MTLVPTIQGVPTAQSCRWCKAAKYEHSGALLCRLCDGPIHLLVVKPKD